MILLACMNQLVLFQIHGTNKGFATHITSMPFGFLVDYLTFHHGILRTCRVAYFIHTVFPGLILITWSTQIFDARVLG